MRGRPKKSRTEAERHEFRLESSKMSHAKARRIAWGERHKSPSRTSAKPPPSLDALRDAYQRRNESCEAMIRLGSMLEDIEAAHGVGYKFEKYDDSGTADSFFIDYDTPWQTGIRGASSRVRSICSPRTRRSCATRSCPQTSERQSVSTIPTQPRSFSIAPTMWCLPLFANVRTSCWMVAGGRFANWRRGLRGMDNNRGYAPNPALATR